MSEQVFEIGERSYPIEDCYIVGFYEDGVDQEIQWNIVVEFPGEDVYASFENITIKGVRNFNDLENKDFILEEDDLEENFLYEGVDEELVYVDAIHFGAIDADHQTIDVEIQGFVADDILDEDEDSEEVELEGEDLFITLTPQLEGIYFITQNKKNVEKFVKDFLKKKLEEVEIDYEEEDGVWNCIINYN